MINIDFKFRAVGQGAFYTGIFKHQNGNQFSFVYDCGTHSSRQYIDQEIINFVSETSNKKIDILFISHLHDDHINKISDLLNQTGGAKLAVLPYLNLDELILAYTDVNLSVRGGDTLSFIQDPINFLLERKVEQVIFIHPTDEKDSNDNNEPDLKDPDFDSFLSDDFDFEISNQLVPNNNIKEQNPKVSHYYDLGRFSIVAFWEFKFFNKHRDLATLNNFHSDLGRILGTPSVNFDNIATYIKSHPTTFESNFNTIYSQNFGYGQLINDTSLVIYHGGLSRPFRNHRMHFSAFPYWSLRKPIGTLLTGDIRFNQDCLNQIQSKWIDIQYIRNIGIFQVPHHGANHYLEPNVISTYKNVNWWVINFGLGNTHKHPHQNIVDVIENNKLRGRIFANTQTDILNYKCLLLLR
ncbi:MBL fold metallo-hydrolase [Flavobacterium sp. SLB02]|uniref:MBL fold metallo-hydrolase n=1 Tax=Flavobacterium sp. SLB02 TaxID=2665645 RepID=UPI0012AA320A|nr:MBL fold metallo-hydrolase [Flavobacterium sp. SLB02]QGK73209.1 hypothetical protein GIY83_03760 [Flavobacterium sp. SLB02]